MLHYINLLFLLCRIIYIQKCQYWGKIFQKFEITLPSTITVGRVRDSWRKEPVMRNREICCGKRTGCFVSYESGATDSFSTLTQRRYRFFGMLWNIFSFWNFSSYSIFKVGGKWHWRLNPGPVSPWKYRQPISISVWPRIRLVRIFCGLELEVPCRVAEYATTLK